MQKLRKGWFRRRAEAERQWEGYRYRMARRQDHCGAEHLMYPYSTSRTSVLVQVVSFSIETSSIDHDNAIPDDVNRDRRKTRAFDAI